MKVFTVLHNRFLIEMKEQKEKLEKLIGYIINSGFSISIVEIGKIDTSAVNKIAISQNQFEPNVIQIFVITLYCGDVPILRNEKKTSADVLDSLEEIIENYSLRIYDEKEDK